MRNLSVTLDTAQQSSGFTLQAVQSSDIAENKTVHKSAHASFSLQKNLIVSSVDVTN